MPNTHKPSADERLLEQLSRTLNVTKASHDEVTQVLIHLLACQIASYPPLVRNDAWDCAVDTLDDAVEDISEMMDAKYIKN